MSEEISRFTAWREGEDDATSLERLKQLDPHDLEVFGGHPEGTQDRQDYVLKNYFGLLELHTVIGPDITQAENFERGFPADQNRLSSILRKYVPCPHCQAVNLHREP